MQSIADSLFDRVLLGGALIVGGLLIIIFYKKLTAYRVNANDGLPWYIHGGAIGSLIFMIGIILFGIMLILLGIGVLYGSF